MPPAAPTTPATAADIIPPWVDAAEPTPRQREFIGFFCGFRKAFGRSPTLQEAADAMGVSRVTVFEHVSALTRRGLIVRVPGLKRNLRLGTPAGLRSTEVDAYRAEASRLRELARVAARLMREAHGKLSGAGESKLRAELKRAADEIAEVVGWGRD